ncbi:hypothetical protein NDI52_33130 [Leptolyngbya sp. PL-A3]|uniref:hypothetical protein n=1 Tax=Leptolyngbya sp. PL-A3 TaxID=2933911 RepID=UPI0032989BAF
MNTNSANHRPHLTEGQHWHKIRGVDHIDRVFYSLTGLERLAQLVATPQAQTFWQSVQQHTQPGGALVQVQAAVLYTEPCEPTPIAAVPMQRLPEFGGEGLAPYPSPDLWPVIERTPLERPTPSPGTSASSLTPHETAALIFKAQEVLGEQISKTQAQTQAKANITIWQQFDGWLSTQDSIAIGILYALICSLVGLGSYYITELLKQPNPNPVSQSQVQSTTRRP